MPWGWIIALAGLCLTIGGGLFASGHKQGKTDQKVDKHDDDINNLWDHQRVQDGNISKTEKAIERIDTNIDWIKRALGGSNET